MAKFQSFEDSFLAPVSRERLTQLRHVLKKLGVHGFILPRTDEYLGEMIPPFAERVKWLSGFSGTAGCLLILEEKAFLFVDGRYTLQAQDEVDTSAFDIVNTGDMSLVKALAQKLAQLPLEGAGIGYDPWLLSVDDSHKLDDVLHRQSAHLVPLTPNPVDGVWLDRPQRSIAAAHLHPLDLSGQSIGEKVQDIAEKLFQAQVDALFINDPSVVSWLFNIRGKDIAHTPLVHAMALVHTKARPELFIDPEKLDFSTTSTLMNVVELFAPAALDERLKALGDLRAKIRFDPHATPRALVERFHAAGLTCDEGEDPCLLLRACKNDGEIAGMRAAHLTDAVAMIRFLAWFDAEAPKGQLDEISCVEKLEALRLETGKLQDISFPTIAGSGPHGAIVHYRVSRRTNRRLNVGELFLIDSGGQYTEGTTDITRTLAVGAPALPEMRERYTRVLQGHIALASARFPLDSTGSELDALARRPLWEAGLDYEHGTGHGVGSYLCVHEGPQRISRRGTVPLKVGMVLSNEPGFYKSGAYGIRLENLELVVEAPRFADSAKPFLTFDTLTLVPFDKNLLMIELLSPREIAWLNAYHNRVREAVSPFLNESDKAWLENATRALPDC